MISEKNLKLVFVPLVGIGVPAVTAIFPYRAYGVLQNCISFSFFILMAVIIWNGLVVITTQIRKRIDPARIFTKIVMLLSANSVFAFVVISVSAAVWQLLSLGTYNLDTILMAGLISAVAVWFFVLIYEILFLSNERAMDEQVVQHLDRELLDAEVNLLKNELDPHFVYNTLMPLYYLVKNDKQTAEQFAYKLIQVYQYFLENKGNDFITLREEMKFIEDYIFLLQIRYKDGLSINFSNIDSYQWQVLPFSLQLLIENAIKHNSFDKKNPLKIKVAVEKNCLVVSNSKSVKREIPFSTRIGLKNLRTRYRLLCQKEVTITEHNDQFIVKVPLIQSLKMNDSNHYNRRRSN